MVDALIVYNPAAGRISVRPFIGGIVHTLQERGWRVEVAESMDGRHTTQLARMAAQENYFAVFAVGGDGTAGQAASGLIGASTALAILPAGTQNVWALEGGIHAFSWLHWGALRENARLLANSPVYSVDVGLCNGQPFLMWAGIGLDAMTVKRLEVRKRFEKYLNVPEFFATTVWNFTLWHGMDLQVITDQGQVEGHYLLAVASNIRHYLGGLAEISPTAYLDDGVMDLWLFAGSTLADAFRHFIEIRAGRHLDSDQARCIPFHSARIDSETAFAIQIDAEPMIGTRQAVVEVVPRALKLLTPMQARQHLCSPPFHP